MALTSVLKIATTISDTVMVRAVSTSARLDSVVGATLESGNPLSRLGEGDQMPCWAFGCSSLCAAFASAQGLGADLNTGPRIHQTWCARPTGIPLL